MTLFAVLRDGAVALSQLWSMRGEFGTLPQNPISVGPQVPQISGPQAPYSGMGLLPLPHTMLIVWPQHIRLGWCERLPRRELQHQVHVLPTTSHHQAMRSGIVKLLETSLLGQRNGFP